MKLIRFLCLLFLSSPISVRAVNLFLLDFRGPFVSNVIQTSAGIPLFQSLVRVGYFAREFLSDELFRDLLSSSAPLVHDYIDQEFVPFGEAPSNLGTANPGNPPAIRPRPVMGVLEPARLGGNILSIPITSEPPDSLFLGSGVPAGSRLFILVYDAATPWMSTELGIFSAINWRMPNNPIQSMILSTVDVNTPDEVFRGQLGSLHLAPLNLPEPACAVYTLSLLAGGLIRRRRP